MKIILLLILISFQALAKNAANTYPLNWEARDGELFEIEITSEDKTTILETKQIKDSFYHFPIPRPGIYYWRVRQQTENKWSPFSELNKIEVEDKISLLEKPLMKKASVKGNEFTFEWDEPFKDFTYVLKVYRGKTSNPFLSLPVQGRKRTITIDKDEQPIYWRISAVSAHGNENKDKKKYIVHSSSSPRMNQYILRVGGFQSRTAYEQSSDDEDLSLSNKELSLTGLGLFLKAEFWKNKYGFVLSARNQSLSEGENEFNESEYQAELGYHWIKKADSLHNLLAGFMFGSTTLKFAETEGTYKRGYLTLRYQYEKFFSAKYSFGNDIYLLQAVQSEFNLPALRFLPALNWYFKNNCWLSALVGLEVSRSNLKYYEGGNEGDLEVSAQNLYYGLSLNWKSF
jgi:hypothetical protein